MKQQKDRDYLDLEQELLNDIDRLHLKIRDIIYVNRNKKRYTLIVENCGTTNILKWNSKKSEYHSEQLKKEIDFYRKSENLNFLPPIIYSEENLILLKYISGKTVRAWIIDYRKEHDRKSCNEIIHNDFKLIINNIIGIFRELYTRPDGVADADDTILSLKNIFYVLYLSVPMSMPKSNLEKLILKVNLKLHHKIISQRFNELNKRIKEERDGLCNYAIHSDLHLNNLLVSNQDLNIRMIDWENISVGSILLDINYFYAFLFFLLEGLPLHQEYLKEAFENYLNEHDPHLKKLFFGINELFLVAISLNRSFSYDLSFIGFIKKLWGFHFKIKNIKI
jgi:hypothetical protein